MEYGKAIIIGGHGFLGSATVIEFQKRNLSYIAPPRHELDLLDKKACLKFAKKINPNDRIIFVAAIPPNQADIKETIGQNIEMAENFCAALKDVTFKHITYVSSVAVYTNHTTVITEETPAAPDELYGAMHLIREKLFHSFFAPRLLITRMTSLFGEKNIKPPYGPDRFLYEAKINKQITLYGQGSEKRDYISVKDAAKILYQLSTQSSLKTINIVSGKSYCFARIANHIINQCNDIITLNQQPQDKMHPHMHFDPTELFKTLPDLYLITVFNYIEGRSNV